MYIVPFPLLCGSQGPSRLAEKSARVLVWSVLYLQVLPDARVRRHLHVVPMYICPYQIPSSYRVKKIYIT